MIAILASIAALAANPSAANLRWGLLTTPQAMNVDKATLAILAVNAYCDNCDGTPTLAGLLEEEHISKFAWTNDGMTWEEAEVILSAAWNALT